jgi:SHS family sialic acid transporter-like MFS transporter
VEPSSTAATTLSSRGRWLVLVAAFLGWFFGGFLLSTTSLAMRSAAIDLLGRVGSIDRAQFDAFNKVLREQKRNSNEAPSLGSDDEAKLNDWKETADRWFAYYQCAFLFGAAAGGLVFGRLGDRIGRSPAMAASIVCYSLMSGLASLAQAPSHLLVLWFMACLGVGGMWPNGVALLSETWSGLSRPLVAGIMGTAANVGIFALATAATYVAVTPDHWRWMLLVDAAPVVLGLFVLVAVPESPRWLASRSGVAGSAATGSVRNSPAAVPVFRMPLLPITLVGIALATVPLFGGWGSANWMIPWAERAGEIASPPNPFLKAYVHQARSVTGMIGSLLGGWVAHVLGRRRSYFVVSLAALFCAQFTFWILVPTDPTFLIWVAALGFFSGIYFGWLPLFLPELFPTQARSTGSGVSFNFGRILTAVTLFATPTLLAYFDNDHARLGRVTSLCYAVGMIAILFVPDTTRTQLKD